MKHQVKVSHIPARAFISSGPMLLCSWIDHLCASGQIKADHPGISITEVAKILGQKWKEVDAAAKAPFEEQAAKDKARYKEKMAAYKASQAAAGDAGGNSD